MKLFSLCYVASHFSGQLLYSQFTGSFMSRNDSETLSNIVLGEAVLDLISENICITNALLIEKLQFFLNTPMEALRENAIRSAIYGLAVTDN
jgi:hypothetical protein